MADAGSTGSSKFSWILFVVLVAGAAGVAWVYGPWSSGDARLAALKSKDVMTRVAAAQALGRVEEPEAAAAIEGLTAALGDTDVRVRAQAARSLGTTLVMHRDAPGVDQARTALEALLTAPEAQVRASAALALSIQRQDSEPILQGLLDGIRDDDATVRAEADAALSSLEVSSPGRLKVLFDLIRGDDAPSREAALRALYVVKPHDDRTQVTALLIEALKDPQPLVRGKAAATLKLAAPGDAAVVEPLSAILVDTDATVRLATAESLEAWANLDAAAEALRRAIDDTNVEVRSAAALGLLKRTRPPRAEALKRLADGLGSDATRADLAQAIGSADASAIPQVLTALNDPAPAVRAIAAGALGELALRTPRSAEAAIALGRLLDDPEPAVRVAVAESLSRFGKPARDLEGVVPSLRRASESADHATSAYARAALKLVDIPDQR